MSTNTAKSGLWALLFLFAMSGAQAEVRVESSRLWNRARLINPGQKIWSFQTSFQESSKRFASDGSLEPLGQVSSRAVTWAQLLQSESAQGRADLRASMRKRGVSESDVAATAEYTVERKEYSLEANWAFGLTKDWMIGLRLPLALRTTRVRENIEMVPTLVGGRVRQLAEEQLSNSGYDHIPDQKQSWDWGDISLLSQHSLWAASRWQASMQEMVRFPTAQSPSITDYIQSSSDEGQTDLGVTLLADYNRARWLGGVRLGYVVQLPDTTRVRTPLTSSAAAPRSPTVNRNLGDWVWSSLDLEYKLARNWDINGEHTILSKARDSYSGDVLTGSEYAHLADHSDQQLQQSRLGILYRIGGKGFRDGVLNRWTTAIDFTYPWGGRNATEASRTSLEVISYF